MCVICGKMGEASSPQQTLEKAKQRWPKYLS